MKTKLYAYDVVSGLNKKIVLESLPTREKARAFKRQEDLKNKQVTHRIIQRVYSISTAQEVR